MTKYYLIYHLLLALIAVHGLREWIKQGGRDGTFKAGKINPAEIWPNIYSGKLDVSFGNILAGIKEYKRIHGEVPNSPFPRKSWTERYWNPCVNGSCFIQIPGRGGFGVSSATKYPFLVDVHIDGEHQCGGSILASNIIISAAHCFSDLNDFEVNRVTIIAGQLYQSKQDDSEQVGIVKEIVIHETFNTKGYTDHDIAIVILKHPLTFNQYVKSIGIGPNECDSVSHVEDPKCAAFALGWGLRSDDYKDRADVLEKYEVDLYPAEWCQEFYPASGQYNMESQICALGDYADTCVGDSGGPLLCSTLLCGIVSFGPACIKSDVPGVYTKVSYYSDWINSVVRNYTHSKVNPTFSSRDDSNGTVGLPKPATFACKNGEEFIPFHHRCDSYFDCTDKSDETGCTNCAENEFECDSGECVRRDWICDGVIDCKYDGSDEYGCGTCGRDEFRCANGTYCIYHTYVCDHVNNCEDGSDEDNCNRPGSILFMLRSKA